jgi:hypothetical protein
VWFEERALAVTGIDCLIMGERPGSPCIPESTGLGGRTTFVSSKLELLTYAFGGPL